MDWFIWITGIAVVALAIAVRRARRGLAAAVAEETAAAARIAALESEAKRQAAQIATFRLMMAKAGLGILVLDGTGDVLEANPAAREFVGARHGAALAEARLRSLAAEARRSGDEAVDEFEVRTPLPRTLRVVVVPVDEAGLTVAYVEDVSNRRKVDAARTDFVANVSHELKTPLGALALLVETLETTQDSAVRARLLARVGEQASRMNRLVDDILDLSLVEAAGIEPAVVDLEKVAAAAAADVRDIAAAAGVELSVESAATDVRVTGDERQLVSAVTNLLSNGITYTADAVAPRRVIARLRVEGDHAVIEVQDTGIGIPANHRERIFERFYRVDSARSRETGGTGLGLAIVRHVALNHGGNVEVESESGIGSTFRIVLPLEGAP